MRMSQELALQISIKMTETKKGVVDQLEKEYREYITQAYIATTPKDVLECAKKHPDYFEVPSYITMNGKGFHFDHVYPTENIAPNNRGNAYLNANDKVFEKAKKLQRLWDKEKEELKALRLEIKTALNGLRTFAQIAKHLPEAVPYLPKSSSVELMVNFDTLRSKLAVA